MAEEPGPWRRQPQLLRHRLLDRDFAYAVEVGEVELEARFVPLALPPFGESLCLSDGTRAFLRGTGSSAFLGALSEAGLPLRRPDPGGLQRINAARPAALEGCPAYARRLIRGSIRASLLDDSALRSDGLLRTQLPLS